MNTIQRITATTIAGIAVAAITVGTAGPASAKLVWCEPDTPYGCPGVPAVQTWSYADTVEQHRQARMAFVMR